MRAYLGHDGPPQGPYRENVVTGDVLTLCPLRTILLAREQTPQLAAEVERYVEVYYPAYQDKLLLTKGGIADQPARYLSMIGAVRDAEAAIERKREEIRLLNSAGSDGVLH
jgi:hypothetical protein